jgi:CSLREA domain-containing protein
MRKLITGAAVAVAFALTAPTAAQAGTFNVNTEADTTVPDGCTVAPQCSLRDAVAAAESSGDATDTIAIPAGDYVLTAGELDLEKASPVGEVTLDGADARTTTIDAGGASRVFDLINGDIVMNDLTITGGLADLPGTVGEFPGDGGAILTRAPSLRLERVAVTDSVARLNGGGIAAPPESGTATEVTLLDSTIAGNRVTGGAVEGLGGGLYVLGDLSVTNSTISGNSVDNPGIGMGAGITAAIDPAETDGTTLTVLNSTIAGNTLAVGGMGAGIGVANPTPGVVTTVDLKNTIVAGNTSGELSSDCSLLAVPTSDNNLSSDATCQFTDEGSLESTDPQLGALVNNGGPTDTRALAAGSPAIDAGTNDGCPPADQRGVARPQGPDCDIGAFERVPDPPPPPPVDPSADLAVKLKAKPKRPKPGKRVKLTLTAANAGPDAATATVVTGKLPKAAKKLKGKGTSCKVAKPKGKSRKFTCRLGELAAGSRLKLKAKAKVGKRAKRIKANARIGSAVADPSPGNDKAKVKVKVKRPKR